MAQVMINAGFSNFTTKDLAGDVGTAPGGEANTGPAACNPAAVISSSSAAAVAAGESQI